MLKYVKITLLSVGIISFVGCASKSIDPYKQEKIAKFTVNDINNQIKKVKDAQAFDNLSFFAPKTFQEAKTSAYNALTMYQEHNDMEDIFDKVQESKKLLTKAYDQKALILKELAPLLEYKSKFEMLHASTLYHDEYEEIKENISTMIQDLDDGEGVDAFSIRDETLQMARNLYSKIKISTNLHSVKEILNNIDPDVAPRSFQKAKNVYEKAKFTINKFPDNEEQINTISAEALNMALYAQTIELETKKMSDLEESTMELYLINLHDKLLSIDKKLETNNKFKTLSLESKFARIKKLISQLVDTNQQIKEKNNNLTTKNQQLSSENIELNKQLTEIGDQNVVLEAQVSTLDKENQQYKLSSQANQEIISTLKTELENIHNDTKKLKDEIKVKTPKKVQETITTKETPVVPQTTPQEEKKEIVKKVTNN